MNRSLPKVLPAPTALVSVLLACNGLSAVTDRRLLQDDFNSRDTNGAPALLGQLG